MSKDNTKLAGRYAGALQRLVAEQGDDPQRIAAQLTEVAALWNSQPELPASLLNPLFSREQRARSLRAVVNTLGVDELVQRFLQVVFARDRIAALPEIAEVFARKTEEAAGLLRVKIRVAREVPSAEKAEIEASLRTQLQGDVLYSWSIEPEILGGLIVEYGGHVLDGSVSGRLGRLERELLG